MRFEDSEVIHSSPVEIAVGRDDMPANVLLDST